MAGREAASSQTCRRPRHGGCLRRLWRSCPLWRAGPVMPGCWRGRRGQSWRWRRAGRSADSGPGGEESRAGPAPAAGKAGVLEAAAAWKKKANKPALLREIMRDVTEFPSSLQDLNISVLLSKQTISLFVIQDDYHTVTISRSIWKKKRVISPAADNRLSTDHNKSLFLSLCLMLTFSACSTSIHYIHITSFIAQMTFYSSVQINPCFTIRTANKPFIYP